MKKNAKIFVAGHNGLVGSAILRRLQKEGFKNIITRTHTELDLTNQAETLAFFETFLTSSISFLPGSATKS